MNFTSHAGVDIRTRLYEHSSFFPFFEVKLNLSNCSSVENTCGAKRSNLVWFKLLSSRMNFELEEEVLDTANG